MAIQTPPGEKDNTDSNIIEALKQLAPSFQTSLGALGGGTAAFIAAKELEMNYPWLVAGAGLALGGLAGSAFTPEEQLQKKMSTLQSVAHLLLTQAR